MIWRRVLVRCDSTIADLHATLQATHMRWFVILLDNSPKPLGL
jgi:hypothetical protein